MNEINDNSLEIMLSMGIEEEKAVRALTVCSNDLNRAIEWILNQNERNLNLEDESLRSTYLSLFEDFKDEIRIPTPFDCIYKDECVASFQNSFMDEGIFICMKTFICVGIKHLFLHHSKTNQQIYLNRKTQRKKLFDQIKESPGKTRSFASDLLNGEKEYEDVDCYSIYIFGSKERIPLDHLCYFPDFVSLSVQTIISSDSKTKVDELNSWEVPYKVSEYALNLVQINNGVKIPRYGNKCSFCDLKENLWINLTDGTVLCGRQQPMLKGNSHSLQYYIQTNYPLCVKLGTINKNGADVFSYSEDDLVKDPFLEQHLLHFGIDMNNMTKTEKSMNEYDLEFNLNYEWNAISEDGLNLVNCYGPELTGIINLGNSCYLASILQILFNTEEFITKYYCEYDNNVQKYLDKDSANNFYLQMSKISYGLCSGDYSNEEESNNKQNGIRPLMFKNLIGQGHEEFSSMKQQDASEFYQYLLNYIQQKESLREGSDPTAAFRFSLEEKLICGDTGKIKFTKTSENLLSLPLLIDLADNKLEYFSSLNSSGKTSKSTQHFCLNVPIEIYYSFLISNIHPLENWTSPITKRKTTAYKSIRMNGFPKYLMIQVQRFYAEKVFPYKNPIFHYYLIHLFLFVCYCSLISFIGCLSSHFDWTCQKLNAAIHFPDKIDFSHYKAQGKLENEELFPEEMTFQQQQLIDMGFSKTNVVKALRTFDNDAGKALEWLIKKSNQTDPIEDVEEAQDTLSNDVGMYSVIGFISHMGTSSMSGHYVSHLKKKKLNNQYVIFNDNKVARSVNPPIHMGYLYLLQRVDTI